MNRPEAFTAKLLETSVSGFAGYAASLLLERMPELRQRYGASSHADWKASLSQRVMELAAALGAGHPNIFLARVNWLRNSFLARDLPEQDLQAGLASLKEVLSQRLPAANRLAAIELLQRGLDQFDTPISPETSVLDRSIPGHQLALQYLQTVLEGNPRQAVELLRRHARGQTGTLEIFEQTLAPAQREIGRMWHAAEINVAEEHLVTQTTQRAMAVLSQDHSARSPNGKTVLAAAVAGNSHDIGVRMLSHFFELAGWRAVCLGPDMPRADLAAAVHYFNADLLILSAALSTQLKRVQETISAVREAADRDVAILVGGSAFEDAPDIWKELGADACCQGPGQALATGGRLCGLPPASDNFGN